MVPLDTTLFETHLNVKTVSSPHTAARQVIIKISERLSTRSTCNALCIPVMQTLDAAPVTDRVTAEETAALMSVTSALILTDLTISTSRARRHATS